MIFPIKKILVNWVDGMKTNKEHLVQMENFFIDSIRDNTNIRLTNYNFGILPPYYGEKLSANFEISERITNHIEVELRCCNAVTIGGCRIDLNPIDPSGYIKVDYSIEDDLEKENDSNKPDATLTWDVILSVNPFHRIPSGIPDPEETPLRHPNAMAEYKLIIKKAGQITAEQLGMNHLIIGRIIRIGTRFEVDKSFIPPCTSMSSYPDLISYYEIFGKYLYDIETSAYKIIQKINDRGANSSVAINVKLVCENILKYISQIYFAYRNKGRSLPPIDVIDMFSSLSHTILVSINFISKKEREEMLQYFYEWSEVTPGNFIDLLTNTLEIIYDHHKIRNMMQLSDQFLQVFSQLWIRLSSLEYIGQRKENIVVAEKKQIIETTQKSEWSILD